MGPGSKPAVLSCCCRALTCCGVELADGAGFVEDSGFAAFLSKLLGTVGLLAVFAAAAGFAVLFTAGTRGPEICASTRTCTASSWAAG